MKILSLTLTNYCGIRQKTFVFDGKSKEIHGQNAAGKSTIADAWSWLLTDKPMSDAKNYSPQTLDQSGNPVHNLDHTAEAEVLLADGSTIDLKKVYKEKWTKKRGSAVAEFTGYVTEYYVDGLPMTKTKYNTLISSIVGDTSRVQLLSNLYYFNERMKWQDRRQLLLDICGDVTDYDVIKSAGLEELPALVGKHKVEDYMTILKTNMKRINSQLNVMPSRIDEAKRAIEEDPQLSKEDLERLIGFCEHDLAEAEGKRNLLTTPSGEEARRKAKILEIRNEIQNERFEYGINEYEREKAYKDELREASMAVDRAEKALNDQQKNIEELQAKKLRTEEERSRLTAEYREVKARKWQASQETCPTCGQQLPAERIYELKAKFNAETSRLLEDVNKRGASVSRDVISSIQNEIDELKAKTQTLGSELILAKQKLSSLQENPYVEKSFEETEIYAELDAKLKTFEFVPEGPKKSTHDLDVINIEISNLKDNLSEYRRQLLVIETNERQKSRVKELEESLIKLQSDYDEMARKVWLCEKFIQTKVSLVTENINKVFRNISFKLFEQQINGGIRECCEAMVPGPGASVPYQYANYGAKVLAGLEIIEVLSKYYGVSLPVFADNFESITRDIDHNGQLIMLVADREYEELEMI